MRSVSAAQARLAPVGRVETSGRRWSVAASLMLHLVALAVVVGVAARLPPPAGSGDPSYDLVFEGSAPKSPQRALPPSQPADVPAPDDAPIGPPTPSPLTPPLPDAAGTKQPELATAPQAPDSAAVPPEPAVPLTPPVLVSPPVAPAARLAPAAPPAAEFATPAPSPVEVLPQPAPPAVRLQPPSEQAENPAATAPIMPQPPPPLPALPRSPPPRPRAASRAAPGTLANPLDLSLGPVAPRPATRGYAGSRGLDLSVPLAARSPSRSDPYAQIRAANASEDWNRGLMQFWLQHRFYPAQAAEQGDQGSVTIELTVARSGSVESVRVLSTSGSQWLDMAAVGTFRGARLRPFTEEMREERITFPVPITYYLVHR